MAEKLAGKESEMRLLQDRLVTLMKDNDMLAGDKKTLSEQKELFEVGGNIIIHQGSYRALKVLKSLEFDWIKFKALKTLNFTKWS